MKKTYKKPAAELLAFTLDQNIATSCGDSGQGLTADFSDSSTCVINSGMGDTIFVKANSNCSTIDAGIYCYYTSGISVFSS